MRAFLHKITKRKNNQDISDCIFLLCSIAFDFSRNNIFFASFSFRLNFFVRTLLFYLRFIWCESLRSNNHILFSGNIKKCMRQGENRFFYSRSCINSNIIAKSKNLIISTLRLNASQNKNNNQNNTVRNINNISTVRRQMKTVSFKFSSQINHQFEWKH